MTFDESCGRRGLGKSAEGSAIVTRGKIGRNDQCWCGSGKKFKRCHLDRESQPLVNIWDASKVFRRAFSHKKCLAPDAWQNGCSGKIARAHTVPKSGSLQLIAQGGHVYSFVPNLENLQKHKGELLPQLLGINKASTFTGFCSAHDNNIFVPLEKQTFTGTREQCFLLAYRALAREIYTKMAASDTELADVRHTADKGEPLATQVAFQEFNRTYNFGLAVSMGDLHKYKLRFDTIMESRRFATVRGYVIEFDNAPPVMCSCAPYPLQDFNGTQLQTLTDLSRLPDMLSITSFYGGERGVVAFSWLAENDPVCRAFIDSLKAIPDELVTAALLRLFFTYAENIHMAPGWWKGLQEGTRNLLVKRMKLNADFSKLPPKAALADDGISFAPWTVTNRYEI